MSHVVGHTRARWRSRTFENCLVSYYFLLIRVVGLVSVETIYLLQVVCCVFAGVLGVLLSFVVDSVFCIVCVV